jgi:serine/threonine protein kinase
MTEPSERASVVIAEYLRRKDAGEAVDEQQLLQSYPELNDELQRFFQNEALIDQLADSPPLSKRETVHAADAGDSVPARSEPLKELPAEFGRYRVLKILGQGAMGAVYLAHDTALDRKVALKTPKLDASADPDLVERFEREARAAATLHHRNICPVFDVGEIEGVRYLTMAYIEGKSLAGFVSGSKQLTERQVAITVRKLALALAAAHDGGVVHRDLKPANVMVDKTGEPVIMDFGLARKLGGRESTRLTQVGTIMGSPAYMSPEQVSGNPDAVGPQSDIYSLGVILFELLTARLPFEGSIAAVIGQIVTADPPDIDEFRPGVDPRLQAICQKMMAKSTGDRYQSMNEVVDALSDVLRNRKAQAGRQSVSPPVSHPASSADSVTSTSEELAIFQQIAAAEAGSSVRLPPRQRTRQASAAGHRRTRGPGFDRLLLWQKWTAAGFGGLLLLSGVIIFFKGGRVEVEEGSTVNITQEGDTTRLEITPPIGEASRSANDASLSSAATSPEASGSAGSGAQSTGWTDLFNGRDFTGWVRYGDGKPVTSGWIVEGGAIHHPVNTEAGRRIGVGDIMTTGTYEDFELEFDWKVAAGANSGVIYRVRPGDPQSYFSGPEYQILDDLGHENGQNPKTSAASIYNIAAPVGTTLRPVGEWNTGRIVARGAHLEHWLNGRKVLEIEVGSPQWDQAIAGTAFSNHPQYGAVRKGHIVLQDHHDAVWFRNLRLRELSADPDGEVRTVATEPVAPPEYAGVLTGQWDSVMDQLAEQADRGARAPGSLLQAKQENGVLELQGHRRLPFYSADGRNMAIRARLRKLGKFDNGVLSHPALVLRHSPSHDLDKLAFYAVVLDGRDELTLGLAKNQGLETLESVRSSAPLTDEFELVLAAVDERLTVYVNGRKVMDIRDDTLASGYAAFELINSHVRISSCELMHLDNFGRSSTAPASPSTTPTSAVAFPPDSHFTGARALTELNQPGVVNAYPCIAADGLAIYWTRENSGAGSSILQATRPSVDAPFGAPRTVLQGARMGSISPDQLEIVCLFDEDGDGAPAELCSARRSRAEDVFPTPRRIESLRSVIRPKGSAFSRNGLSLLILGQENPEQPTSVWLARRGNVSAAWEQAQRVKIQGELRPDDWVTHPSVDLAGEHLLLSYTEAGARHLEWGAVADRTDDPFTFENFRPLLLDGERFVTRGGRYCDATGEIFFTRPIEPSPYREMQLWVARATQSLRPAAASSR